MKSQNVVNEHFNNKELGKFIPFLNILIFQGCLLFFVAYSALPFIRFGTWSDSEPITSFIFLLTAAAIPALFFVPFFHLKKAFSTDLKILSLFILWSVFLSLFHSMPGLDWLGPAETGLGISLFLSLGLMIFIFRILIQNGLGAYLIGTACLSGTVIATINVLALSRFNSFSLEPFYEFNSFLGFLGVAFFIYGYSASNKKLQYSIIIASIFILYFSQNLTAIIALPFALFFTYILGFFSHNRQKLLTGIAFVAIPFSIIFIEHIISSSKNFGTLWSRVLSQKIVFYSIQDNPIILLIGSGWGKFSDQLLTYFPAISFSLMGLGEEKWDALRRIDFHSHNFLLETLSATGIIGLALLLAFYVCIVLKSPKEKLKSAFCFFITYIILCSNWFEMPITIPFTALAIALVTTSHIANKTNNKEKKTSQNKKIFLIIPFLILLFSGWANLKVAFENNSNPTSPMVALLSPIVLISGDEETFSDFQRGGSHLSLKIQRFIRSLHDNNTKNWKVIANHYDYWLRDATSYKTPNMDLLSSKISLLETLYTDLKDIKELLYLRERYINHWHKVLPTIESRAPLRSDLLISYFNYQLTIGSNEQVRKWVEKKLKINSKNHVALLFLNKFK